MNKKAYVFLLNFVIVDLIIILFSLINALGLISDSFDYIVKPFSSSLRSASSDIGTFLNQYTNGGKLQSQNFELNKEIINLKEQTVLLNELQKENDFLKSSHLEASVKSTLILSPLISVNTSGTVLIAKGAADGVKEGDIVLISQNTVLGRIKIVNQFSSNVELIGYTQTPSQKGVSVASTVDGKEVSGFVKTSDDQTSLVVNEILKTNPLYADSIFTTTGNDTIYPRGLIVGSVNSIVSSDTQTSKLAILKVNYDILSLKFVYILKLNK